MSGVCEDEIGPLVVLSVQRGEVCLAGEECREVVFPGELEGARGGACGGGSSHCENMVGDVLVGVETLGLEAMTWEGF